jgi:hypothetical protein
VAPVRGAAAQEGEASRRRASASAASSLTTKEAMGDDSLVSCRWSSILSASSSSSLESRASPLCSHLLCLRHSSFILLCATVKVAIWPPGYMTQPFPGGRWAPEVRRMYCAIWPGCLASPEVASMLLSLSSAGGERSATGGEGATGVNTGGCVGTGRGCWACQAATGGGERPGWPGWGRRVACWKEGRGADTRR